MSFRFWLTRFLGSRWWRSPKSVPAHRCSLRPRLEILERRLALATFTNIDLNNLWEDKNNWSNRQLPEASDGIAIIPPGFTCILNAGGGEVSVSTVSSSGALYIAGATLKTADLSTASILSIQNNSELDVTSLATVTGSTDVGGVFDAQGATANLGGIGSIEPNGAVQSDGVVTFTGPNWEVFPGGQLSGDGLFNVNGGLTIDGSLTQVEDMALNTNGTLGGPGSFQAWHQFAWNGGTMALGNGFTIEPTAEFTGTGAGAKYLYTTLTNDCPDTTLGGGTLYIAPFTPSGTAALTNYQGTIDLSTDVSIGATGGTYGSFVNQVATIDVVGDSTITGPFSSDIYGASGSVLDVGSGITLTLAGNDSLGGDISNSGTIAIPTHDTTTVANNLTYNGAAGSVLLVSGGTLAVSSAANLESHGAIEVATQGTLSAQGPIDNYGTLTLDPGGSTFTGSATLTNEGGLSVGGSGDLLSDSALVTNDATGTVTVSAGGRLLASGGFTNDGTLTDGGTMTVTGPMDNHGSVEVQSGGVLQDSGAFTNDAVLQVDAGGLLGADSLDEAGSLIIQIASAGSYGAVNIISIVTFEDPNYLTVELVGGYNPLPGTEFAFLNYGSESGTVSQITSPDGNWTIIYDTHTAYLVAG